VVPTSACKVACVPAVPLLAAAGVAQGGCWQVDTGAADCIQGAGAVVPLAGVQVCRCQGKRQMCALLGLWLHSGLINSCVVLGTVFE
jgi:hypothetical protein